MPTMEEVEGAICLRLLQTFSITSIAVWKRSSFTPTSRVVLPARGGKLGYAKAVVHQLTNQTGSIFILYDCDNQFHIHNTSCFGM